MSGKRVVFQVIQSLTPGGAERVVVHLLQYHDRTQYQPVCVCLNRPEGTHYEQFVRQLDVPLHFLERRGGFDKNAYRRMNALFREYNPTIVHTHLLGLNYAYPLMLRHRTPVRVHTVHNIAQQELKIGKRLSRVVRVLAFRYRLGGVTPVAVSAEVARTVEKVYGLRQVPTIPNGIDLEQYRSDAQQRLHVRAVSKVEDSAVVIVHVGRFNVQKNHEMLLRAFARLRWAEPTYLWLLGDGELMEPMRALARELQIEDRVRFWGIRSDVAAILNASDIFVLPSRWEGLPLSLMEAMAAGLPVVATAVGGVPEIVEHGVSGFLVPNEDEAALVEALQRLIDTPELRRAMGARARARAQERFDARAMTRAYEALYESILARR
ncbi:MAG: glycosyltransferase [Candidatus Caldarchaeum sp.]